jgi:cytochrome c
MPNTAVRFAVMVIGALAALSGLATAQVQGPSAERGRALYESRCVACHSVDANRVGPAHQGVLGRKAGSVPGFDYSKALASSKLVWTRANLVAWLAGPEAVIPGQGMNYSLGDAKEREDVVAYLATLGAPAAKP